MANVTKESEVKSSDYVITEITKGSANDVYLLENREGRFIRVGDETMAKAVFIKDFLNAYSRLPLKYKWSPELLFASLIAADNLIENLKAEKNLILAAEHQSILERNELRYWNGIYRWGFFIVIMGLICYATLK